jgi:hypothetical protein
VKKVSTIFSASAATLALFAAIPAWAASAVVASPASRSLPCRAWMSNSHPSDYTTTYVKVHTVGYAAVTTVAHYRTTDHKKTGRAGKKGNASIGYYISGATPGYKVVVSVRVVSGKRSGSCSTWFIPNR